MNETTEEPIVKVNVFKRSWLLTKSAWQVLRADKELALLPLIGMLLGIVLIIVMGAAAFAGLVYEAKLTSSGFTSDGSWTFPATLIVGSLLLGVVSNFIAGAMVHGVIERLNGGDPTVKSALAGARRKFKAILLFSLFTGIVGLVLQYLSERVPFVGKIFVWLGGAAFNIATFFALPVIVNSEGHVGPVDATKQSIALIRKVWGESLVVNVGIGLVSGLSIIGYLLTTVALTIAIGLNSVAGAVAFGIAAFVGLFVIALLFGVLSAIAKTAIFFWATTGKEPATFSKDVLRQTFTPKKARKLFV